jgi:hypothetical protein
VLDERGRTDLAERLSIDADDVENHCCSVVGASLAPAGDPYKHLEEALWKWSLTGRKDLPPFTALLFTLSHAAELMVSDSNFNAANYYQRLAHVTGIAAGRLSQHGRSTEQFWRSFNGWLAERDFRHGRPTARAVNSNRYVGIAMSQAIVREEDRLRFHSMFEKYGFTGTDVITEEEITQYIENWITTSRPTRQLKAAWAKPELKSRIAEIAVAELEDWTAEITAGPGVGSTGGKRLSLAISFRNDLFSRATSIWLGREDTIDDLELLGTDGEKATLGNSTFGSFATIEPRSVVDLSKALSHGVSFKTAGGEALNWAARAVIPLSRSNRGAYWTEVNRVTVGVEHLVLVRSEPRVKKTVESVLEEVAAPGYTVATPDVLQGLPPGWLLYEKVSVLRQLDQLKGFEAALSPVGQTSGLQLTGGLRIGRGIYHEWAAPTATLETQEPGTRIAAWEGTAAEGEPLGEVTSEDGHASLDLATAAAPSGSLYIEGWRGRDVVGSATILLRSAARPRPLDRQGRGEVAYADALSACPLELAGPIPVRGFDAPFVGHELQEIALASFTSLQSRDLEPERPAWEERSAETEQAPIDIRLMPVAEQIRLPCAVRCFHEFKMDTVGPNYPRYAPVNMVCMKCGVTMLHRRHPAARSERKAPTRAVPQSPRGRREAAHSLPYDLWLDAACFLGSGPVATLEGLLSGADLEPWHVGAILRDLALLGHLDLCLGDNHRPRSWSVAPPVLAYHSKDSAVLAGFRSKALVDDVEELVTSAGGTLHREEVKGQPAVVEVRGLAANAARKVLDIVADPHGRLLKVVEAAPRVLATFSQASGSIFSSFRPVTLGNDCQVQRYDVEKGKWKSAPDTSEPGAYRLAYAGTTYALRTAKGRSLSGPHELVKLAAARARGIHLHAYSESERVFSARLGCEPPGLLGRTLVACSGRLPIARNGESHFAGVPPVIAGAVLACLYSGDLPS